MTEALYTWMAMPGVITQAGTLFDVSLRATTTLDATRERGVERVEFRLFVNGTQRLAISQTAESTRRPNFTDEPSRMPGAPAGSLAPFPGYGFSIDPNAYPVGEIEVDATVYSVAGTATALPTLVFYNRVTPPCTKVIHLDFDAGNDANDGSSWAQAVRTVKKAQELVRVT